MLHAETDQPLTQWAILAEFQREVVSAVSLQPLSDFAFSLFSSIVPGEAELEKWQAEHWVRRGLLDIAETIPNETQRSEFIRAGISERELINVLEYAESEDLLRFASDLVRLSASNPKLRTFLKDKFDNVLYFAGEQEKIQILSQIAAHCRGDNRTELCAYVLRSSESLSELELLIASKHELVQSSGALREIAAYAKCARFASELKLPAAPAESASVKEILQYRAELEQSLNGIIRFCSQDKSLASSRAARDLMETAASDLNDIALECSVTAELPDLMLERLKVNCALLELEIKYGVNISYGNGQMRSFLDFVIPTPVERWRLEEVDEIKAVLEAIPQGHVLFSPNLREIQRVDYLGDRILGARYRDDGVIKLASLTFGHAGMEDSFEGVSSLSIVLAHEIGHGLQIGTGPSGVHFPAHHQPAFGNGEARYDFDEYVALSGWRVISRDRYSTGSEAVTVRIDGKEYQLDKEIEFEGKKVFLTFDAEDNLLLAYDAKARFSYREYARTNPWEDFAEAFAEYIFVPERLISLSPEKFRHLELELRRYHDNPKIQALLKDSLIKTEITAPLNK